MSKNPQISTCIGTGLNIDIMSKYADYFKELYGKHTVALEFLAEAGAIKPNNVTKPHEMGTKNTGVGPDPNFLRVCERYRYPVVLKNVMNIG